MYCVGVFFSPDVYLCCTHRPGDRQEAIIADEDDVEDRSCAEEIIHHQPQLAQSTAQHPLPSEDVRDVHRNAERP